MQDLLIITNSYDVTTDLLLDGLAGQAVFRFNFDQFASYRLIVRSEGFILTDPTGRSVSGQSVCKAYWRKPFNGPEAEGCGTTKFVDAELRYALRELVNLLWLDDIFVLVEPYAEKRTGKLTQLHCARPFFNVPEYEFLYNSESKRSSGVVKSLSNELVGDRVLYTTRVQPAQLSTSYPWFVQQEVRALADVTVVFVRGRLFAFSLKRDFLNRSVDWRRHISPEQKWIGHQLPGTLEVAIREYMVAIRLDYGRLDFLIDEEQRYWFLEVNPNGQFAWLDLNGEQGLLAAIVAEVEPTGQKYALSNRHPLSETSWTAQPC